MKALGEEVKEYLALKKILRSSPMKFNSKLFVIKEKTDFDSLTKDELQGILIAYEMRVRGNESKREIEFNVSKKNKIKKIISSKSSSSELGKSCACFKRKIKKKNGKNKGKFRCFNCGR